MRPVIGSAERWARRLDGFEHELAHRRAELDDDTAQAAALEQNRRPAASSGNRAAAYRDAGGAAGARAVGQWLARIARSPRRRFAITTKFAALGELDAMAPVGPVGLDEVRHVLAERLAKLGIRLRRAATARSLSRRRIARQAMSFEVVIVPGLAERIFPQKVTEDPILLDASRAALGVDLIRNEDRVASERLALRIAAGAAEKRVMFLIRG